MGNRWHYKVIIIIYIFVNYLHVQIDPYSIGCAIGKA